MSQTFDITVLSQMTPAGFDRVTIYKKMLIRVNYKFAFSDIVRNGNSRDS